MKPVARKSLPVVAYALFGGGCRSAGKQYRFPRLYNKAGRTGQSERLPGDAVALHGNPAFLDHLTVCNGCACHNGKHARHATKQNAPAPHKARTQDIRQPRGNGPDESVKAQTYHGHHLLSPSLHKDKHGRALPFLCIWRSERSLELDLRLIERSTLFPDNKQETKFTKKNCYRTKTVLPPSRKSRTPLQC